MNLSGYGNSGGKPSEKSFYNDGLSVFNYVLNNHNISAEKIILLGRSIGAATAIYVASKIKPGKLIIVTPFESVWAMVPTIFKFFMVTKIFLKNKFDNIKYIKDVICPVLILSASHDEMIPFEQVKNLYSVIGNNAVFKVIEKTNHQNMFEKDDYFKEVNLFLN